MAYEFEALVANQMFDIALVAREKIVDADHFVAERDELVAQVRAEEAGAAGDQNRFSFRLS